MTTKEFIENIANGTFSKNDVLIQSEVFPDKKDLLWDLWMADKACLDSTGKPQVTDDAEITRISNAIGWLSEYFKINIYDEAETPNHHHSDHLNIPDEIANSQLAMELLNKCKEAGLLDENYQPIPDKNGKKGTTGWQLKQIADHIGKFCNFKNRWKTFGTLWGRSGVDKYKSGKGVRRDYIERQEIIDKLFEPYAERNKSHISLN